MDDIDKDYMLDQAMASICSFKKAVELINTINPDKTKKKTPAQKIKYLTEFISDEHDRIMSEYNKFYKDGNSTT